MIKPVIVCYSNKNENLDHVFYELHKYFGPAVNQSVFNEESALFNWLENNENHVNKWHLFVMDASKSGDNSDQIINKISCCFLSAGILIITDKVQKFQNIPLTEEKCNLQILNNSRDSNKFKTALDKLSQSTIKFYTSADSALLNSKAAEIDSDKLEERIHKLMDANMAKDSFMSIIAHDLKSPFFSLLGISEILLNEWENLNDETKLDLIGDLHKTSDDTYKLLVTLLDWSKLQKEKLEVCVQEVNICNLVNSTLKTTKNNAAVKGIKIENKINTELKVKTDRNMIATVFRNLISNAVQYIQPGGKINISASEGKDFYTFCIEDNGGGIDKPHILELFKPGNTKKLNGNTSAFKGLGLIISKDFVEKNGGQIWLETQKETGSKFFFTLPCMN